MTNDTAVSVEPQADGTFLVVEAGIILHRWPSQELAERRAASVRRWRALEIAA